MKNQVVYNTYFHASCFLFALLGQFSMVFVDVFCFCSCSHINASMLHHERKKKYGVAGFESWMGEWVECPFLCNDRSISIVLANGHAELTCELYGSRMEAGIHMQSVYKYSVYDSCRNPAGMMVGFSFSKGGGTSFSLRCQGWICQPERAAENPNWVDE